VVVAPVGGLVMLGERKVLVGVDGLVSVSLVTAVMIAARSLLEVARILVLRPVAVLLPVVLVAVIISTFETDVLPGVLAGLQGTAIWAAVGGGLSPEVLTLPLRILSVLVAAGLSLWVAVCVVLHRSGRWQGVSLAQAGMTGAMLVRTAVAMLLVGVFWAATLIVSMIVISVAGSIVSVFTGPPTPADRLGSANAWAALAAVSQSLLVFVLMCAASAWLLLVLPKAVLAPEAGWSSREMIARHFGAALVSVGVLQAIELLAGHLLALGPSAVAGVAEQVIMIIVSIALVAVSVSYFEIATGTAGDQPAEPDQDVAPAHS
jgi:hypothetical protein